jgi:hypothetical protein
VFLRRWWFLLLLVAGVNVSSPLPPVAGIVLRNTWALDTLRSTVAWGAPAPNGFPYDSLNVAVFNLMAGGWMRRTFVPPFPVTTVFEQYLTFGPGVWSATYDSIATIICAYQRGGRACASAWSGPYTYTAPVSGDTTR